VERQRTALTTPSKRATRGRDATSQQGDPELVARYEKLLAALERAAVSRQRTDLSTRLGRGQLKRPARA
jgi:hypothetical protein